MAAGVDDGHTFAGHRHLRVIRRAVPWVLLMAALTGIAALSQGFRTLDTVGLLVCGAVAGAALAEIAVSRRRKH